MKRYLSDLNPHAHADILCAKGRVMNEERIRFNLGKTVELVNAIFALKLAWLKEQHPDWDEERLRRAIYQGILSRKERQWTLPVTSSQP